MFSLSKTRSATGPHQFSTLLNNPFNSWPDSLTCPSCSHYYLLIYCVTRWRVGWAIGQSCITPAIRNIHTKVYDYARALFQEVALTVLTSPPEYCTSLRTIMILYNLIVSRELFLCVLFLTTGVLVPRCMGQRDLVFKLLGEMGLKVEFKFFGSFEVSFMLYSSFRRKCL